MLCLIKKPHEYGRDEIDEVVVYQEVDDAWDALRDDEDEILLKGTRPLHEIYQRYNSVIIEPTSFA